VAGLIVISVDPEPETLALPTGIDSTSESSDAL